MLSKYLLLETGGGLKKAAWFLKDAPFLIYNADILTNINLKKFYNSHLSQNALATLAVRNRESSRHLLFNQEQILSGWQHNRTGEQKFCRQNDNLRPFAFSGLHVISPEVFDLMPDKEVFSIIDVYLEAGKSHNIIAYPHDDDIWLDVGKLSELEKAKSIIEYIDI